MITRSKVPASYTLELDHARRIRRIAIFYDIGGDLFDHQPQQVALIERERSRCSTSSAKAIRRSTPAWLAGNFDALVHHFL